MLGWRHPAKIKPAMIGGRIEPKLTLLIIGESTAGNCLLPLIKCFDEPRGGIGHLCCDNVSNHGFIMPS
jgi:hypothetical protein